MAVIKLLLKILFAVFFIVAGVGHFTNEPFYMKLMPDYIPTSLHRPAVVVSGIAEIVQLVSGSNIGAIYRGAVTAGTLAFHLALTLLFMLITLFVLYRDGDKFVAQVDHIGRRILPERLIEAGLNPASPVTQRLVALTEELIGFPRHLSQHVGGFVIARGRLDELVPVENAAMPDRTVIQWDKDDLETMGLLKVDCLALGMLTAIRKCLALINEGPREGGTKGARDRGIEGRRGGETQKLGNGETQKRRGIPTGRDGAAGQAPVSMDGRDTSDGWNVSDTERYARRRGGSRFCRCDTKGEDGSVDGTGGDLRFDGDAA